MSEVKRVNQDELQHDENGLMYLNEDLFTGVALWFWDNGQLGSEMSYVNGALNGWSFGWHKNGRKESETFYNNECVDGIDREWYENGQIKVERELKNGKAVWKKEWDEKGNLIIGV